MEDGGCGVCAADTAYACGGCALPLCPTALCGLAHLGRCGLYDDAPHRPNQEVVDSVVIDAARHYRVWIVLHTQALAPQFTPDVPRLSALVAIRSGLSRAERRAKAQWAKAYLRQAAHADVLAAFRARALEKYHGWTLFAEPEDVTLQVLRDFLTRGPVTPAEARGAYPYILQLAQRPRQRAHLSLNVALLYVQLADRGLLSRRGTVGPPGDADRIRAGAVALTAMNDGEVCRSFFHVPSQLDASTPGADTIPLGAQVLVPFPAWWPAAAKFFMPFALRHVLLGDGLAEDELEHYRLSREWGAAMDEFVRELQMRLLDRFGSTQYDSASIGTALACKVLGVGVSETVWLQANAAMTRLAATITHDEVVALTVAVDGVLR